MRPSSHSYEQVLFPHDEQTLNMGVLQDLTVTDPGPPPTQVPVMLAAPMAAGRCGGVDGVLADVRWELS